MNNEKIEVLQTANEYLNNLKNGILRLVELMQQEKDQEANLLIPQISDGIDWILKAVELTRDVQKEYIKSDDINEYLEAILEAMENEDIILVGDLFNYEVLPIIDRIHSDIKRCIAN